MLKQLTVDLTRAVEDEKSPAGRLAAEAVVARLATSGDGALLAERLAELTREVQVDQKLSDDLALVRAATLLRLRGEEDPVTLSKRVVQNVNLATKMVQARQALRKERR